MNTTAPLVQLNHRLLVLARTPANTAEAQAALQSLAHAVAERRALLDALKGCAAALAEAGKDFAAANPLAKRPNLYEMHAAAARTAIQTAEQE